MKFIKDGFFKRNKKILIIVVLLSLICAMVGAGVGYVKSGDNKNAISKLFSSQNVSENNDNAMVTSIGLFFHNITVYQYLAVWYFLYHQFY